MTTNNKKGFTLVELSIVLVIIGLLIGGILVAQSMIGTAKIQALTRQIGQFDAAVQNFRTKFNQLPGDTNLMGATPGDNDGQIETGATNYFSGEFAHFWYDLSQSGLANSNGAGTTAYTDGSAGATIGTTATNGNYFPSAQASTGGYFVPYGASAGTNYYFIAAPSAGGAAAAVVTGPAFTPANALAVDVKLDNGLAGTGNVIGNDAVAQSAAVSTGTTCTTVAGNNIYKTATPTPTCNLAVRIGTSTGTFE